MTDHTSLSADQHLARRKCELESKHDSLSAWLGPNKYHPAPRESLQLPIEKLLLGGVRPSNANGWRRARIGGHGF